MCVRIKKSKGINLLVYEELMYRARWNVCHCISETHAEVSSGESDKCSRRCCHSTQTQTSATEPCRNHSGCDVPTTSSIWCIQHSSVSGEPSTSSRIIYLIPSKRTDTTSRTAEVTEREGTTSTRTRGGSSQGSCFTLLSCCV